jgi:uncharacterized membrane protein
VQPRSEILDWAGQGRIADGKLRRALEIGAVLPTAGEWRAFLDRLLLFLGAALLCAAVIFFFAFNWSALGRFAKFALVQAPLLIALAVAWRIGLERLAGKVALLAASLLAGALLALIGQTYQTGADTFELFAAWAVAILPWVLVARFAALWIVWLLLLNLAAILYYQTFPTFLGVMFGPEPVGWVMFALNTAALAFWEAGAWSGLAWLRERWGPRLVALASGGPVTMLALLAIFASSRSAAAIAAWLIWIGAVYAVYRHSVKDLFMLAGAALSVIVIVTALLARQMSGIRAEAGVFLFIGLAVIGMSAAAGFWLRRIAAEEKA